MKVILVQLRRPDLSNPDERRSDPFYEFGSFGCTGCHKRNLLHPRNAAHVDGARLAFHQGGPSGTRLIYLTPPVTVRKWPDRCEVLWDAPESERMPFRYRDAPILIRNGARGKREGVSDFPLLLEMIAGGERGTLVAQFSSNFRSRKEPLPPAVAREIIEVYAQRRAMVTPSEIARTYDEALPFPPPRIDRERRTSYSQQIDSLDHQDRVPSSPRGSNRRRPRCN